MKYLLSLSAILLFSTFTFANPDVEVFSQPSYEFEQLDQIESFIDKNQGISLNELKNDHADVLAGVTLIEDTGATLNITKEMPLLGGFWWGCCLGIIGLALVYFITDNDKLEVKNALIGCIISTLVVGVGGILDPFNWF